MSIRDQERRQQQVERRIDERMRQADREVGRRIEQRASAASHRAEQVKRRIEKGDIQPRPLPSLREDSLESMESMRSIPSMESMPSMESADYKSEVTDEEAADAGMMQDMPLEGVMPYDPASAEEDLAQRVTEETGSDGDPHAHNESKADKLSKQFTEDTDSDGDMTEHAEHKVNQMGREMFEE